MDSNNYKTTPLYETHLELGGKMIEYAGFNMPVEFTGVISEHLSVRETCGVFDVSHMGEFLISGDDAVANLNRIMTNEMSTLKPGKVRYTLMCNDSGGIIDDLLVYCITEGRYLLIVNAANRDKDFLWISDNLKGDCIIDDLSDGLALLAVQGPESDRLMDRLLTNGKLPEKYYSFNENVEISGIKLTASYTGYTGERGFELLCRTHEVTELYNSLLNADDISVLPCGLAARDTLRLEAAFPLYGHELNENITPIEAGLGFAVKTDKDFFIGKESIINNPVRYSRIGLKVTGRGIAREGNTVELNGENIGTITSGTYLPYLKGAYAMASVSKDIVNIHDVVTIDIRGRKVEAEVVKLPFYKSNK
ncbi:MAG: glycine cleavage system aminomethyltransferase GcvT [Ruminococcaceae bacterium]|nr:glycine cleavage system aminomethyltransferase GcvT [Oscillospiraceae bacterium]